MENTREIVLDLLLALERGEGFSHQLIRAVLDKYNYLDARDKAFIKRTAEGTVERRLEIDYYLDHVSSVPVSRMKPLIRCLMRMSVYQMLYMDNVPDPAVCNEACKLAQKRKFGNLKGFVNGVLRSVSRQKERLPMPDAKTQNRLYLSVRYSMPEWLIGLWEKEYGAEKTESILKGLLEIHPVSLRFRTTLTEEEKSRWVEAIERTGAVLCPSAELPYVYRIDHTENITELPGYAEGVFAVQDLSSAMAVEAAGISPGDHVLDLCAAPGGKSMLAAEKAGANGRVRSCDLTDKKALLLEENKARMRLSNMEVLVRDATQHDERLEETADVLLADLPCSGFGVIGKKRDIKYRVTGEDLEAIMELQKRILTSSWSYVKKGGVLLYSTCTIHRGENEETAAWLTAQFPFALEEERQFLPGTDEADGFYYAKLRRIG